MFPIIFNFQVDAQDIKSSGNSLLDSTVVWEINVQVSLLNYMTCLYSPPPTVCCFCQLLLVSKALPSLLGSLPFPRTSSALLGTAPLTGTLPLHGLPASPARPTVSALESPSSKA